MAAFSPTTKQRQMFAKMGIAMPDGSYYVRNADDLDNAIKAVGRGVAAGDDGDAIRKHIMKRAAALNLSKKIPDTWNSDGSLKHADTSSDEPTAAERKMFAKMGIAMPDGSYYVRNAGDLENAIRAVGRGEAAGDSGDAIRIHIMKRAAALKRSKEIPDTWNADGSLKHDGLDDEIKEFFEHFGVKGMHWGVRKSSSSEPSSADAQRAKSSLATAKKHGTHVLTNDELKHLTDRLNLEQSYKRLTADKGNVDKGHDFVKNVLSGAKTGLDIYNTGVQVKKAVDNLK